PVQNDDVRRIDIARDCNEIARLETEPFGISPGARLGFGHFQEGRRRFDEGGAEEAGAEELEAYDADPSADVEPSGIGRALAAQGIEDQPRRDVGTALAVAPEALLGSRLAEVKGRGRAVGFAAAHAARRRASGITKPPLSAPRPGAPRLATPRPRRRGGGH